MSGRVLNWVSSEYKSEVLTLVPTVYFFGFVLKRSRDSSFGKVIRLLAGRSGVGLVGMETGWQDVFSLFQNRPDPLWRPSALIFNTYSICFLRVKWPVRETTTHLNLVPRLRMSGSYLQFPYMAPWHGQGGPYLLPLPLYVIEDRIKWSSWVLTLSVLMFITTRCFWGMLLPTIWSNRLLNYDLVWVSVKFSAGPKPKLFQMY